MKDYRVIVINMIEDGMLDWELVGREMLARMSMDEVEKMVFENDWENGNWY